MRQFSASDLADDTNDVLDAAAEAPIAIARHDGEARFVLLSAEAYARLRRDADPRLARRTADIPAEEGAVLEAALTRLIEADT